MIRAYRGFLAAGMIAGVAASSAAQVGGGGAGRAGRGTGVPIGATTTASVGIAALSCAQCTVHMNDGALRIEYGGEPMITAVARSDWPLHVGDVLVAVDGALITTTAGGERFTSLQAGKEVRLTIRRDGKLMDVAVVPYLMVRWNAGRVGWIRGDSAVIVRGPDSATFWHRDSSFRVIVPPVRRVLQQQACRRAMGDSTTGNRSSGCDSIMIWPRDSGRSGRLSFTFGRGTRIDGAGRGVINFATNTPVLADSHGWLGFGIECHPCSITVDSASGARSWTFGSYPTVMGIDPKGPAEIAGLHVGDQLRAIDGNSISTPAGAARFGKLKPGDRVRLTVERNGKQLDVTLTVAKVN